MTCVVVVGVVKRKNISALEIIAALNLCHTAATHTVRMRVTIAVKMHVVRKIISAAEMYVAKKETIVAEYRVVILILMIVKTIRLCNDYVLK